MAASKRGAMNVAVDDDDDVDEDGCDTKAYDTCGNAESTSVTTKLQRRTATLMVMVVVAIAVLSLVIWMENDLLWPFTSHLLAA